MTYGNKFRKQTAGFTINELVSTETGKVKRDEKTGEVIYERRPNRALKRKIYSDLKREQKKENK
jgi:hypothetical protein